MTAKEYSAHSIENAAGDIGRQFLYRHISAYPKEGRLIAIGCGTGLDLAAYKKMGFTHLVGIDPSEKFIAETQTLLGNDSEIRRGTFEEIPYDDDSFDLVTTRFALHYSKDIPKAIKEIGRVLKKDGALVAVISHPLADSLETPDREGNITITLFKGNVPITFPQHTLSDYFSEEFLKDFDIRSLFEYCGTEQDRGVNGLPNALGFVAIKR